MRLYTALANFPEPQRISPQPGTEPADVDDLIRMLADLTSPSAAWPTSIPSHFFAELALRTLRDDEVQDFPLPSGQVCTPAELWRSRFQRDDEFNPSPWPIVIAPFTNVAGSAEFLLLDHWDGLFEIRSRNGNTLGKHPIPGRGTPPTPGYDEAHRFLVAVFERDRDRAGHLFALGALYQDAQLMIRKGLSGQKVTIPPHLLAPTRFQLSGRSYDEESSEPPLFQPWILDLVREDPCPFWLCQECARVFVVPRRGKPPVYCSPACRASGIPSARRRSEYMRHYRQKRADEELAVARVAIAGVGADRRLATLRRRFPAKSRRQLVQLLQRAEAGTESGTAKEEPR